MAKSKKQKSVLTLKNGSKYDILSEKGKYYICRGAKFRKQNTYILDVKKEDCNNA